MTTKRPAGATVNAEAAAAAVSSATRYTVSAVASLSRASPSRRATIRRGTARRSRTAVAAISSGGETIAPSAIAIGTVIPGTRTRATPAATAMLARTRPTAREAMLPISARKLRIGVRNAVT